MLLYVTRCHHYFTRSPFHNHCKKKAQTKNQRKSYFRHKYEVQKEMHDGIIVCLQNAPPSYTDPPPISTNRTIVTELQTSTTRYSGQRRQCRKKVMNAPSAIPADVPQNCLCDPIPSIVTATELQCRRRRQAGAEECTMWRPEYYTRDRNPIDRTNCHIPRLPGVGIPYYSWITSQNRSTCVASPLLWYMLIHTLLHTLLT
jgi:hypothetical protein